MSQPIATPSDAPDGSGIIAKWDDGISWQCPYITVGMIRKSAKRNPAEPPLWSGVRTSTNHALHLAQRPDRHLLLSLYEQGVRQRLQVKMNFFGELPLPQPAVLPRDHPIVKSAVNFMQPIAEDYASGKIPEPGDLLNVRDDKLKAAGLVPIRATTKTRKRPAADTGGTMADAETEVHAPKRPRKAPIVEPKPSLSSSSSSAPARKMSATMPISMEEEIEMMNLESMSIDSDD
jgi:hypothetical protein